MSELYADVVEKIKHKEKNIAAIELCNIFIEYYADIGEKQKIRGGEIILYKESDYEKILSAYAFLLIYAKRNQYVLDEVGLHASINENVAAIYSFVIKMRDMATQKYSEAIIDKYKEKWGAIIGEEEYYKIKDEDFKRMQELINEIRTIIQESKEVEEKHKIRLLEKVELLQSELNKTMTNFDKFWGKFIEIGGSLGRFGADSKPLFDRLTELSNIVFKIMGLGDGTILLDEPKGRNLIE